MTLYRKHCCNEYLLGPGEADMKVWLQESIPQFSILMVTVMFDMIVFSASDVESYIRAWISRVRSAYLLFTGLVTCDVDRARLVSFLIYTFMYLTHCGLVTPIFTQLVANTFTNVDFPLARFWCIDTWEISQQMPNLLFYKWWILTFC